MLRKYVDGTNGSMGGYCRRSITGAVLGAVRTMYGNHLRSTRRDRQGRDTATRVTCYNIEVVARERTGDGRLAPELVATSAA